MTDVKATPPRVAARDASLRFVQRRSFLKFAGATILATTAAGLLPRPLLAQAQDGGLNLGTGDIAVLNFAYALEQLEATFYIKVTSSFYSGVSGREPSVLSDLHEHEVAHREFFQRTLEAAGIPALEFDFSAVNFRNRESVLTTARTFEDIGVAAYNGAGQLLRDPNHLLAAGRIVSVEARHAAEIRRLRGEKPWTGAFDEPLGKKEVLAMVSPFIRGAASTRG